MGKYSPKLAICQARLDTIPLPWCILKEHDIFNKTRMNIHRNLIPITITVVVSLLAVSMAGIGVYYRILRDGELNLNATENVVVNIGLGNVAAIITDESAGGACPEGQVKGVNTEGPWVTISCKETSEDYLRPCVTASNCEHGCFAVADDLAALECAAQSDNWTTCSGISGVCGGDGNLGILVSEGSILRVSATTDTSDTTTTNTNSRLVDTTNNGTCPEGQLKSTYTDGSTTYVSCKDAPKDYGQPCSSSAQCEHECYADEAEVAAKECTTQAGDWTACPGITGVCGGLGQIGVMLNDGSIRHYELY
ncbi:MAG: hypothetical protein UY52_C0015G0010 [Parcubacteria group bacterium GW2011_GWC2_49_9]|nr:MAG: hypothetical protein UY52_C0015G0010 [Parcubacteria group bacterium GW2011_GWC2_49_9]